jgi:hypothetical protein
LGKRILQRRRGKAGILSRAPIKGKKDRKEEIGQGERLGGEVVA